MSGKRGVVEPMATMVGVGQVPGGPRFAPGRAPGLSDEDRAVVEALRRGDALAFEALHQRLTPLLLAIAVRATGSRALAEDVVQDTWLGVMQGVGRFEGRCALKTWIIRILHYRARTAGSREARSVALSALGPLAGELAAAPGGPLALAAPEPLAARRASPEDEALRAEVGAAIAAALARLPSTQRAVVVLRDVQGWPAAEVCLHLKLSAVNQRVLLHRARRQMRRALSGYHWPGPDDEGRGR